MKDFLDTLEANNELKRISAPMVTDLEIAQYSARSAAEKGPALLFENIPGHDMPVLVNAFASEKRICLALGISNMRELGELTKRHATEPGIAPGVGVETSAPPCQEIILKDDKVDLNRLPALRCWPGDAGYAINMAVVQTLDMETGDRNLGIYRLQIFDRNHTGLHWHKGSGGDLHYRKALAAGKALEVTAFIAPHPSIVMAASMPLPHGMDELRLASVFSKRPVKTTPAMTVSHEVPSGAGIVLEGVTIPPETHMEGPFGNHTGYYSPPAPFPVFHVRCISMQKKPLFQATVTGPPPQEDCYMAKAAIRAITPFILKEIPEISDIDMPLEGIFFNIMFVAIFDWSHITAEDISRRIWATPWLSRYKVLFLFNEGVDLQNQSALLWRFGNNLDPLKGIITSEGDTSPLDPASGFSGHGGKACIDCRQNPAVERYRMDVRC